MGVLVAVGAVIASAVATTAAVVATIVTSVVAAVVAATASIAAFVAGTISTIVATTVSGISMGLSAVYSATSSVISTVVPLLSQTFTAITAYTKALVGGMKLFLEAIHFQTLLRVHQIAMLVSSDYREMIQKVYGEIAKVSDALGFGAEFITLVLQDARNIVLDVSGLMGQSYDLAQVKWLTTMNDYLKEFSDKAESYENNPGLLLHDISDAIDKPAVNAKSAFQRNFLSLVDNTIKATDDTAKKLVNLREDLEKAVMHLPKEISRDIYKHLDPVFEKFDSFILFQYRPAIAKVQGVVDILEERDRQKTDQLKDITHQILNPGELLSNIDKLPRDLKDRQERTISEVSTRAVTRDFEPVNREIEESQVSLEEIYKVVQAVKPKPKWYVKEYKGPVTPAFKQPKPRQTWFVGDF